jgi:hypothetical protein
MTEKWITAALTVMVSIIGLAALAALVSNQSDTTKVIGAGSSGFACLLCAVLKPVGVNCNADCLTPDVNSVFRPTRGAL